jgi:hypothetical protein
MNEIIRKCKVTVFSPVSEAFCNQLEFVGDAIVFEVAVTKDISAQYTVNIGFTI